MPSTRRSASKSTTAQARAAHRRPKPAAAAEESVDTVAVEVEETPRPSSEPVESVSAAAQETPKRKAETPAASSGSRKSRRLARDTPAPLPAVVEEPQEENEEEEEETLEPVPRMNLGDAEQDSQPTTVEPCSVSPSVVPTEISELSEPDTPPIQPDAVVVEAVVVEENNKEAGEEEDKENAVANITDNHTKPIKKKSVSILEPTATIDEEPIPEPEAAPQPATETAEKDERLVVDALVSAKYNGFGYWHPGKIVKVNSNGTYHIAFTDGTNDVDESVKPEHVEFRNKLTAREKKQPEYKEVSEKKPKKPENTENKGICKRHPNCGKPCGHVGRCKGSKNSTTRKAKASVSKQTNQMLSVNACRTTCCWNIYVKNLIRTVNSLQANASVIEMLL